jgi:hypothetical protein
MSKALKKIPAGGDPELAFTPDDLAEIQTVTVARAKQGDMRAVAIVERMWRRRRRTVRLDLPPVNDASGLAAAQAAVIAAAAAGRITPHEGMAFAAMLDYRRRALDTIEFEARLREVENANVARNRLGTGDSLAVLIGAAAAGKPDAR